MGLKIVGCTLGYNEGDSNSPHGVHVTRVAVTNPKLDNAIRVVTHPSKLGNGHDFYYQLTVQATTCVHFYKQSQSP